jgi:amino acid permease
MSKGILGFFLGCLSVLVLLCCCCFGFIIYVTSQPNFYEGYCKTYFDENGSFEGEPFGWCNNVQK